MNPGHRPSRTELRGAVYGTFLGGQGHHGWTPWRVGGISSGADGSVQLDILWLPDHYGPEREPRASNATYKFGSWMVRTIAVTRHADVDRLEFATTSTGCQEFTVTTIEPVLLSRRLPEPVGSTDIRTAEVLYPDERLIIGGLARDWNAAGQLTPDRDGTSPDSGIPVIDPNDAAVIGALSVVSAHRHLRVRRELVDFDTATQWRAYKRCLSGEWAIRLFEKDDPVMRWWFSLLLTWAGWAGIGAGTSAGLGRVQVVPGNTLVGGVKANGRYGEPGEPRRAALSHTGAEPDAGGRP